MIKKVKIIKKGKSPFCWYKKYIGEIVLVRTFGNDYECLTYKSWFVTKFIDKECCEDVATRLSCTDLQNKIDELISKSEKGENIIEELKTIKNNIF